MFQPHGLIGLIVTVFLSTGQLRAEDPRPSAEMKALIETVKAGLRKNDDRLGRLKVKLTSILESPEVKEAKRITKTRPDGTQISYSVAPKFENRIEVIQEGEKIRHTYMEMDGEIRRILVFDGKLWRQFVPGDGRAWIRTPAQIPDYGTIYPISFGTVSMKPSVVDVLEKGELLSARRERKKDSGNLIVAEFRFSPSTHRYFEFDSEANYFPVTIGQYNSKEKTFANLTFRTHQRIEGRQAWYLKNADMYIPNVKTNHATVPEKYHQKSSLRVKSIKVLDSEKEPKDNPPFELDLPIGVWVSDIANRRSYRKGGPKDPNIR